MSTGVKSTLNKLPTIVHFVGLLTRKIAKPRPHVLNVSFMSMVTQKTTLNAFVIVVSIARSPTHPVDR